MKKVLIITYYWPPSGGGGVMRWLKMAKYLPEFGWNPIIYTPENPDSSVTDESLLNEVHPEIQIIKTPIWEPYKIYRKLTGKGQEEKFKAGYISEASSGHWKNRLSVFIRGNFLIPDPRKFWIKPSIRYLKKYLKTHPVDLIISTGPPHSMHLIALGLKKRFDIPWIADFRDPWTDIDFYSKLRLTKWADKKHRALELNVLTEADHIVTVSPDWSKKLRQKCNRKIEIIYNGFDSQDYDKLNSPSLDTKFSITHFGAFNRDRNPVLFWKALKELINELPELKEKLHIQLIGQTDESIVHYIQKNNLNNYLTCIDYLHHKKGLEKLAKSQVLLLPINDTPNAQGIIPGKMYEYLALRRPILAIGPTDADFAEIIKETDSGVVIDFHDLEGMKLAISNYFELYKKNRLYIHSTNLEKYSRKNMAKKFMELAAK